MINSNPLNPEHLVSANSQPTHLVAYKETREGIYGPYEVEVDPNFKKEVWPFVSPNHSDPRSEDRNFPTGKNRSHL